MKEADRHPATNSRCWLCKAAIDPLDRFCRACGATVMADANKPRETLKKRGRRNAAIMFLSGIAILLFAVVHHDPADIILVVVFGLPLCGAGAMGWRTA
jgi:predicted nucleic acid-binding Zn ribbon protein